MSYNPYARYRYGGELYHGRKKISEGGARNGYSNTPGYTAKGRKAVGRIIGYQNGRPIYEYTDIGTGTPDPRSTAGKQRTLLGRVGLLAGRVGSTVSRAAGNVGRTVSGAANQAVKTVKKTARNAYNAVGNAWDGKAGKGTAKDLARLSRNPERENTRYNRSIKGRLESAGRAISGAGRSAGNWLTGRANDVGKAARSAGNAIYNRAGRLWDGAAGKGTGADRAKGFKGAAASQYQRDYDHSIVGTANRVGNWLNDRRKNIGRAIDRAWDGREGRGDARDTAYEYDLQGRETDAARSREAYNRSIKGRLENAGKAISKAGRNASRFVSDRAEDVGKAARGAANAVGSAARDAGKFVSDRAGDVRRTANKARRAVEEAWDGKAGKGTAKDEAAKMRNISGKNLTNEQRKMRNDLGDTYAKKYSKSIKGQIENAPKNISKAVKGIGEKISGTANSASKKVSETTSKVAKNLNTQVGKVTSEINRVATSISSGANYDKAVDDLSKVQQDYQNMFVQYRQLQINNSKAAKELQPEMDAMRKAYLKAQRQVSQLEESMNSTSLGKASRDAADFVSSVTGSKRKKK